MIFLFEEHCYNSVFLKNAIGHGKGTLPFQSASGFNTEKTNNGIKINGVGYCFYNGQPVFVLPKVFLDDDGKTAFGQNVKDDGKDIFGGLGNEQKKPLEHIQRRFLSSLSLWLYTAIDKYKKNGDKDNGVIAPPISEHRKFDKDNRYATLLDIMSSMELFYKKNQSLFVFVAKNKHSGNHKINWQRTVNKKIPFIQDEAPIYMDLVNKAKVFDLDDRLLVLYFSAMKFIQSEFGYTMPQSEFYQPLRQNEVERLLENERGVRELKKIKHKYFDDRFLKLYNIVEAFFRWGARYKSKNNSAQEYLIANSFNNVFEAMIDDLVGDHVPAIEKQKHNKDGKIIDHLYKEKSLIFASGSDDDLIWHIGDSKYYQDPEDIRGQSIAKQYTYAKNMMQNFFSPDYFKNGKKHSESDAHYDIRYRDEVTEGYSVTPNFFIRGFLPTFIEAQEKDQYSDTYFRPSSTEYESGKDDERELIFMPKYEIDKESDKNINVHLWENRNRHFENRLFDRDTLLLQVYNVNFLYVLKAYTSKQSTLRKEFRDNARRKFRENFLELLDKKYVFYAVWPQGDLKTFVNNHFRTLIGKIFQPQGFKCLILALETDSEKDSDVAEMWEDIEKECEMIARVTPREIWEDDTLDLPEANFEQAVYDESFHGFFVKRKIFEREKIGKKHKLPSQITNRPIAGNAILQIGFAPNTPLYSDKNEYYFLPCKEESSPHSR